MSHHGFRRVLHGTLAATALWSLLHLANDIRSEVRACRAPAESTLDPGIWRVGSASWRQLATTLETVAATVPRGAPIAFRAPAERWMLTWYAAYLLPHHHVLSVSERPRLENATHAVALEQRWDNPALDLLHATDSVWIYRRVAQ